MMESDQVDQGTPRVQPPAEQSTGQPPTSPRTPEPRVRPSGDFVILALAVVIALYLGHRFGAASVAEASTATGIDEVLVASQEVAAGIAAGDPAVAAERFRRALAIFPDHYGANYQLAAALDRADREDEARVQWERVSQMAEAFGDQAVVEAARERLARDDLMQQGLDALHRDGDLDTAAARFTELLRRHPDHYGATYQLAVTLDAAGRLAESRSLWEKMLSLAETSQDEATSNTARARLEELAAADDARSAPR